MGPHDAAAELAEAGGYDFSVDSQSFLCAQKCPRQCMHEATELLVAKLGGERPGTAHITWT